MSSILHILNPSARRRAWVQTMAASGRLNSPWVWIARDHPLHVETLVDWAIREQVRRLVVWGGDGTLNRVASALRHRGALKDVEVALVPCGTCNDLARTLRLTRSDWPIWDDPAPFRTPVDVKICEMVTFADEERRQTADRTIFLNNAGFGRSRASFERKDGPWRVLWTFRPIALSARWRENRLRGIYYMLLACNAPYFSGGLYFRTNAFPSRPKIGIFLVPATSRFRLALRFLRGRLGWPLADDKITQLSVDHIQVDTDTPVWPQADGEAPPEAGVRHVDFSVLPETLRLGAKTDGNPG